MKNFEKSVADIVRENPNCNYFISASAGTGKTHTLMNYYIGILEYHEKENNPDIVDGILAVTFTNKAANEMKERIMSKVREKITSSSVSNVAYWKRIYSNMSRAVISTIDSFCRRVLIEQNIYAGVDPNFTIINDLKQLKIIDSVSRQAMETAFKVYEDLEISLSPMLSSERKKRIEGYINELKEIKDSIIDLFELFGDVWKVKGFVEDIVTNWRLELKNSNVSKLLLDMMKKAGNSFKVLRLISLIASELYEAETIDNFEYDFKGVLEKTIEVLNNNEEVRKYYQERFKYIIVDEFQDTNELQRMIFNFIHTDKNYIFYVGDRKQSIYRFRGADVSVFVKTMDEFEKNAKISPDKYRILSLQTNYRSHEFLVDYFNRVSRDSIFKNEIYDMLSNLKGFNSDESISEISEDEAKLYLHEVFRLRYRDLYDKLWFLNEDVSNAHIKKLENEVIPQIDFLNESINRVSYLNIVSFDNKVSPEDEANLVAMVIKNLIGKEITIFDKEKNDYITKKVEYKDIAILSYKLAGIEPIYRETFGKFNIPLYIVKGRGFYKRPEIRAVISALSVIQNPNNDYNFVEFFLTPFVESTDFSPSFDKFKILHKIVLNARKLRENGERISFFQSAKKLGKEDLPGYVSEMIELVQKYDELKYFLRPAEVLKGFINESYYLAKLSKFPNSAQRLKNVKKLLDQATEFNQQASTFSELIRLLSKVEELQETEASEVSEEDNVVRMMTVHASKGLEYNIVFLVNNNFNEREPDEIFFPSDDNGGRYIHIKRFIENYKDKFNINKDEYKKLKGELEAELIYDETEILRKIYVAITRAKEMLFVVTYNTNGSRGKKGKTAGQYLMHREFKVITVDKKQIDEMMKSLSAYEFSQENKKSLDEEKIRKQIGDFSNLGYKRYISPTLLYNISDEKSDKELVNELEADFEESIPFFEGQEKQGILEILEKKQEKQKKRKGDVSLLLSSLLETSREVIEGKNIHRRLMSVQRYPDLVNLVGSGELPENILKVEVLKYLFESSDKVISEWRIAKSVVIDDKKYTLFGVPDKVFLKDEKIYVVDFKSSYLKDGSEEVEKYKFQLQFYMYLLRDFGEIAGGYLVGTRSGLVIKVEKPGDDFFELLVKLIRNLEVI